MCDQKNLKLVDTASEIYEICNQIWIFPLPKLREISNPVIHFINVICHIRSLKIPYFCNIGRLNDLPHAAMIGDICKFVCPASSFWIASVNKWSGSASNCNAFSRIFRLLLTFPGNNMNTNINKNSTPQFPQATSLNHSHRLLLLYQTRKSQKSIWVVRLVSSNVFITLTCLMKHSVHRYMQMYFNAISFIFHQHIAALYYMLSLWLIDYLLFYIPLKNISLIWRRHHYRWRAAKFRSMLGAQGLWAGRDLYRATSAVTRDLGFSRLIRMKWPLTICKGMQIIYSYPDPHGSPFSRLLRHARGAEDLF
jgi:hypothetical protein